MGFQDMFTGSFYYDPSGKILYIWLPDGSNPNGHNIEASVRDFIIPPTELQYIELHNLNFSHSNLSSKTAMLAVVNVFGKNWVVSDCSFTYGDLYGLAITGENHKIINNIANHNGNVGISINGSDAAHNWSIYPNRPPQNILLEGNQTSYNNYRKFDARWQAGGIKAAMFCNGITIYHHRAESNIGSGIWFDIACSNIRIEQCIVNNNLGGIAYEISDNAVIANNLVKQNMYQGIYVSASSGVYSLNNTVVQNGYGIVLHGMPRADHPTLENNTLRNNIISNSKWIDLVAFTGTGATGNSSDYNLYDGNLRISLTTNIDYKINYTNLSDFTRDTGQEVHSLNASPQFKNSTTGDYKLLTGSPAIDAGTNLVAGSISNKDLAGNTRIVDGRKTGEPIIDIGTYECSDALQLSAPKSLRVIE
jgi:parallel beta-helix repeat protein